MIDHEFLESHRWKSERDQLADKPMTPRIRKALLNLAHDRLLLR